MLGIFNNNDNNNNSNTNDDTMHVQNVCRDVSSKKTPALEDKIIRLFDLAPCQKWCDRCTIERLVKHSFYIYTLYWRMSVTDHKRLCGYKHPLQYSLQLAMVKKYKNDSCAYKRTIS